jgi:hypothetical protein
VWVCDVAATLRISTQITVVRCLCFAGLLTVLSAGGRGRRSFVGAVGHDVEVWGSRFPILSGGSSGGTLSEWPVHSILLHLYALHHHLHHHQRKCYRFSVRNGLLFSHA